LESFRRFLPGVRGEVLYSPIPSHVVEAPELRPEERAAIRRQLGAGPEDMVILQASRIESWKGPDLVLRALSKLRDVPGWRFWLAGGVQRASEQRLYDLLCRIASEAEIADRVRFLGQRSDVARLMQAADVYCQANRSSEGFGLAFLEANYCGLPIITTDIGAASEIVDSETGILVPAGENVIAFSDALRSLLQEPDLRAALGRRAREKVLGLCDAGHQMRQLAGLLASTCGSSVVARPCGGR
jgi:glycosyltransferase involved in cell wall biosynthesis